MKNLKVFMTFVLLALFVASCSDNETVEDTDEQQQDYLEVSRSSEIDKASASMDDIAIQVYEAQEASEDSRQIADFSFIPECVTITLVAEQGYREITIDFGTEGCLINGNILKGKILLTYTRNPDAQEIMITKTLEDFYFNAKNLIGGKTILKELSNDNGNPQFTKESNLAIIWPNGAQASRGGTKIREWVEGFGSGVWSDNVFQVTGDWSTTFVNGNTHTYTVIEPLRREVICYFFVSGSVDVERTNFGGTFNYGTGECDNMATFTFNNGTVVDIIL